LIDQTIFGKIGVAEAQNFAQKVEQGTGLPDFCMTRNILQNFGFSSAAWALSIHGFVYTWLG